MLREFKNTLSDDAKNGRRNVDSLDSIRVHKICKLFHGAMLNRNYTDTYM